MSKPGFQNLDTDSKRLQLALPEIAKKLYGADSYHIVAHSKGGLDSRICIGNMITDGLQGPKPVSLITMGTPHLGTAAASIIVTNVFANDVFPKVMYGSEFNFTTRAILYVAEVANSTILPISSVPGIYDLTVDYIEMAYPKNTFTLRSAKSFMLFYPIGTSADMNGSGAIDADREYYGFDTPIRHVILFLGNRFGGIVQRVARLFSVIHREVVDGTHQVTGSFATVDLTVTPGATNPGGLGYPSATLRGVGWAGGFELNDVVVPEHSSAGLGTPFVGLADGRRTMLAGPDGGDHSYLLRRSVARDHVIPRLLEANNQFGGMKPW
jgi:hypothetical protein